MKSILVVDDSSIMRKQISKQLNACCEGLTIHLAEDGEMGSHVFLEQNIDLILTDWNMPNMDGLLFIETIRKLQAGKTVPIIMVTSETARERIIEAIGAGANDYIVKPFTEDCIRKKIEKFLLPAIQ